MTNMDVPPFKKRDPGSNILILSAIALRSAFSLEEEREWSASTRHRHASRRDLTTSRSHDPAAPYDCCLAGGYAACARRAPTRERSILKGGYRLYRAGPDNSVGWLAGASR